ncbi:UNVERIFIED_ORG: hypothetical protein J2W74_002010 [Methylorubrum zatmanii]
MTPQSERNATKRLGEIADRSGVSLSTIKRHRRAGTVDHLESGVTQMCPHKSHRDVMAELNAGAEAAQTEWLVTLPPWSMS